MKEPTYDVDPRPAGRVRYGTDISDGDVAQLVERFHGMEEVESSNLFVSTFGARRGFQSRGVFRFGAPAAVKSLACGRNGGMLWAW